MQTRFEKSEELFPIKENMIYLAHCGISPLYSQAWERANDLLREQMLFGGSRVGSFYDAVLNGFKQEAAALLRTTPDHIAAVRNTSEAMSMIAQGYPFQAGDEVITFTHEYPANYYPWVMQEARGVRVVQLPNHPVRPGLSPDLVGQFLLEDLERLITPRTRIVALSHVQFTSGFAADLKAIGALCHTHGIDFVVDAAQSLGGMPLYPEECHISAVASAGWKWLLGPMGSGVFYTAPAFREKLGPVLIGAETMLQGYDYLDHTWAPHSTAKRFEYSTSTISHIAALEVCMREIHNRYGMEAIFEEIIRLQDTFLKQLDTRRYPVLGFDAAHRSGILSIPHPEAAQLVRTLAENGVSVTQRGGFLRIGPHFYNTEEDMLRAATLLNEIGLG